MNILGKARQVLRSLGPAEPPRPQHYKVACPQGHILYGQRTEGYQALRCPQCGDGVFILPMSPLPDPPAPGERKRSRQALKPAVVDDGPIPLVDPPEMDDDVELEPEPLDAEGVEWVEPEAAPAQPEMEFDEDAAVAEARQAAEARARTGAPEPKRKPAAAGNGAKRPRRVKQAKRPMIEVVERRSFSEWAHDNRHPLIFLGVALLVLVTVAYRLQQRHRRELPRIAEIGKTEGIAALHAGEFDTAHRKLAEAAKAVRQLKGAYEGSDEIVQAAAEAAIYVDFIPRRMEEIINEAARAESEKDWQDRFNTLYKGRSVLLDGNSPELRFVSQSGIKSKRLGRFETKNLSIFEGIKPSTDSALVIGARLESITLEDGVWVVHLDPQSVVVMKSWEALKAFGWSMDSSDSDLEDVR